MYEINRRIHCINCAGWILLVKSVQMNSVNKITYVSRSSYRSFSMSSYIKKQCVSYINPKRTTNQAILISFYIQVHYRINFRKMM